ncbi:MAG: 1-deoxy-D-xylulose-5-phosphate reductoisomerase [Dehalococcoidales bacterium]|nr:1-deoxy-D-xylulose-5-phosphate reductoisomerase [Dehalococcoidales bacterium]
MDSKVNRLAILGSTGSIGQQTLQVVRAFPERFPVIALAAGDNLALLSQQINEFHPQYIHYHKQATQTSFKAEFLSLEEMAVLPEVDTVVVSTSGKASLTAVLAAVQAGKRIAIANKEPLVMAGEIITRQSKKHKAKIIPVDSEHSAIWQCLQGENNKPANIILTASGGPFRAFTPAQMAAVTPAQALQHPSWKMGKKVTIDSATLMNKGLEIIEAHWLFGVPFENIKIVVHPQSIIHSMVEFADGSVKAQLSSPDMRLPIQYALTYPQRWANPDLPKIDWSNLQQLVFAPPDFQKFPCLQLAIDAGKAGGTMPAVLCAADEIAVNAFLNGRIKFMDIVSVVGAALDKHRKVSDPELAEILAADAWTRDFSNKMIGKMK